MTEETGHTSHPTVSTKRLSSSAVSYSLASILKDDDNGAAINTRSPQSRLTMQSYFNKENQLSNNNTSSKHNIHQTTVTSSITNTKQPLKPIEQNNLNRRSLSSIKTSSTSKSFKSSNTIKSPKSNRYSNNNLGSSKSTVSSSSNNNNNTNKSNTNNIDNNIGNITNDTSTRISSDTYGSIPSSILEYQPEVIDDCQHVKITKNSNNSDNKNNNNNNNNNNNKTKGDSIVISNIPSKPETDQNVENNVRKSTSFKNLRHSLSIKSLSSISNNQNSNNTNAEKRKSLRNSNRKLSFENIRSLLLTNRRSSLDLPSDYRNNISLPVMQPQTKDKIKQKLRNSSSIVSLSSFISSNNDNNTKNSNNASSNSNSDNSKHKSENNNNSSIGNSNNNNNNQNKSKFKTVDIDQIHYSLLLKLCSQSKPISFTSYLNKFQTITPRKHLTMLKETNSNFIFLEFQSSNNSNNQSYLNSTGVWKLIPINSFNTNSDMGVSIANVIQELALTMLMSSKPGFVKITSASLVNGLIPSTLLDLIDNDNKTNKNLLSINNNNQLYLIMKLKYSGITLSDYNLKNWNEASSIFLQVLTLMCIGEENNYEHRDLNVNNILIKEDTGNIDDINNEESDIEVTIIDHASSRGIVRGQIMYTNLYDAEFFKGSCEYRFTIYKYMRKVIDKNNESDWSESQPIFNLLWIHYLLHTLIFKKGLKPIKMNPILKKKSKLITNSGKVGLENMKYEKLLQAYRMVDPEILLGLKKQKYSREVKNVAELKEWFISS